ncbi:hypothetical protein KSP39_PZI003222 [Platanthera zijinensis]|uniref:Remorin C-terminal domain-containing protein n=1 Tax=Platanthera zijinensis TaxID=2320716 RepID=A0AAP0BWD7_9ASPA
MNAKGTNSIRGVGSPGFQKRLETPSTPGRPLFKFSVGSFSRKNIPSKWEDAEKWLMSSSFNESTPNATKPFEKSKLLEQNEALQNKGGAFEGFEEKLRISEPKVPPKAPVPGAEAFHGFPSSEVILQDTFTDIKQPVLLNFRYSEPSAEEFLFKDSCFETVENCASEPGSEIYHRDVGTEMTPIGSSTTSRCHTPIKISSPARHNTPADRSGPLLAPISRIDISELEDCHFAKLELSAQYDNLVSYWSSREEEEEEVSKSLRHAEENDARKKNTAECRASLWEDDDRAKSCIRYKREEAKIQAWVNLQTAKAEAQSRKLEVKIQKMRSNLEEKVMKKMGIVYRRSEEWRAAAQFQHKQQILRAAEKAQKMKSQSLQHQSSSFFDSRSSCGCFSMQD